MEAISINHSALETNIIKENGYKMVIIFQKYILTVIN